MSPKITIKENYILVEPKDGTDFREIQQGVARLFYVEGIPEQNRIWLFREGPQNVTYDDLHKLRDVIEENYPADAKINKTAIVVESGTQSDLAVAFTKIAENLPQQFKVFSNLADAEAWIKKIMNAGLVGAEEFGRQHVLPASLSFYRASKELLQSKPAASC
jgi:hypothetical protein